MDGTDAAAEESIGFVRDFVVDVGGSELRFDGGSVFRFVEAALDSVLAVGEPAWEDVPHLKSFCVGGVWECGYFLKHRQSPEDFKYFQTAAARCRETLAWIRSNRAQSERLDDFDLRRRPESDHLLTGWYDTGLGCCFR